MSTQTQTEGLCLKYPDSISPQPNITYETAVHMLLRAAQLATHTPFVWGYIDKPSEGQIFLVFITPQLPFPIDGVRYQDNEQKAVLQAGAGRELEVMEIKFGFVPGQDNSAWRVRRRYRMNKGANPGLVLIHYTRGQAMPIMPNLNQPVRSYPLRPITNEPAVFVGGDRVGQKVLPNAHPSVSDRHPPSMMGMGFGAGIIGNPQSLLAQQNSNMDALERRARERSASMNRHVQSQQRLEEDDSADESDMISTRTLALTRYRRNHEFMNEVFMFAAFGESASISYFCAPPPPFSIFDKTALDEKAAKLATEVEELQAKAAARREARLGAETVVGASDELEDVSMDSTEAAEELAT
ncbi:uncharacterized protein LAESUDRAFT_640802 [Laetiporus sulphureus 93-53]|uniref:SWI/SNF and RSC complexes subunit Ssr4 N-terminal domain-containing protein n=1 Tax=Laetiporus sulphureus 93-53 TaxID=1314785 RepID=A0A165HWA9_9APHY|nr:uncharacterized protein LAESUDRAFT_640802 [Laetiporus sulphureus 93-53]KZT12275.1 hypothetical protein LAESUDRAFT_640802 [Laetiporus sulphureus 93-53]